jgi:catechol 2,3-dioxygenase-like lactoylglutathione lyase family enzyme
MSFRGKAVVIACTDLERSRAFYRDVLGAEALPGDVPGLCEWFRLGTLLLSLMPNAEARSASSFPEHAMAVLSLEVDDLGAASRRFKKHRVEILQPSDGTFMMVADPDGVVIEVWEVSEEA